MKLIGFLDDNATEKHIRQTVVMLADLTKQAVAVLHSPSINAYMFLQGEPPIPLQKGFAMPTEDRFLVFVRGSFWNSAPPKEVS